MVIWVKFTFQSILVHWFLECWHSLLECRRSLLTSPVWPLPICLDYGPNFPGSYAILLFTASNLASVTSHIHNWVLFLLWLCSFFLELFLHWSPGACWAPTDLGSSSFSVLSFCIVILFMVFSRQEYWSGLPLPSPVDHILSELSTMICPSWVALHSMA